MNKIRLIFLLTLIFGVSKINGQQLGLKFPDDYNETLIKVLDDDFWATNFSINYLKLRTDCGRILVDEYKYKKTQTFWSVESQHGTLFGSDGGEWVGGFYNKPTQGAPIKLRDINVKFLHIDAGDVFLFEVDNNYKKSVFCKVYRDEESSNLELQKFADLPDVPTFIYYSTDNILYVTGRKNLYKYANGQFLPIFSDNVWKNVVPTDILQSDLNTLLIGIKGGILKVDLKGKHMSLFTRTHK